MGSGGGLRGRPEPAEPARHLHGDAGDELTRCLKLAAAVKEKDAGTETALVVTACGDHASYGGLAGSSYAVQPVDALVAITVASGRHTAH